MSVEVDTLVTVAFGGAVKVDVTVEQDSVSRVVAKPRHLQALTNWVDWGQTSVITLAS